MADRIRVLCVDDDLGILKALRRILRKDDWEVVTAMSGEEALRLLRDEGAAHVLIVDYRMPGMNGVELLKEVRRRWPHTVRIMLSGHADSSVFTAAVLDGRIFRFITKPWNDDDVIAAVTNAVDRFWMMRENDLLKQDLEARDLELRRLKSELARAATKVSDAGAPGENPASAA